MHTTRRANTNLLNQLAEQGRWEEVYQRHVLWEFPSEARMGFQLAFLRPLCDPAMADILVAAGRITTAPTKRAYDTGLIMHEIIAGGLESSRARQMIALMNRQHHHYPVITAEQFTYVLSAFIVAPTRYIARAGWRDVLEIERVAAHRFYDRLGALMAIADRPTSYRHAEEILDQYERTHVRPTAATRLLGRQTVLVITRRLPRPLRPFAGLLFATQINDHRIAQAVGLPAPGPGAQLADALLHRCRRLLVSHRPAPDRPSFTPGQPAGTTYPHGYQLEDLSAGKP